MKSTRPIALAATVGCFALFLFSGWAMLGRIRVYNEARAFARYHFEPQENREFSVYGRPVKIADFRDGQGRAFWRISYADRSADIPVKAPPVENSPKLGVYDEWAKAIGSIELRGAESTGGDLAGVLGTERFTVVSRIPAAGLDPESWGAVKRDEWTFGFLNFKQDGSIERTVRRWPRSDRGEKTLAGQAEGRTAGLDESAAKALEAIEPLKERSLEYQLALHVIPKLNVPKYKFEDDAVNAMGWTLSVAFFSFLGMTLAGCWAAAPRRPRVPPAATA